MELDKQQTYLIKSHPNYKRWEKSRNLKLEKGNFVKRILSKYLILKDLTILDIGSGEGGTSEALSFNNNVFSIDLSLEKLKRQTNQINKIKADAINIPIKENSLDLIILQDTIEHLDFNKEFINKLSYLLKENGIIYLSTPNKFSIFNIISDPHFGLPFLSLLNRKNIKNYFLKYFRKHDFKRKDIAQLLSFNEIFSLFNPDFEIYLNTKTSVELLLKGHKGIIWSDFHISLLNFVKQLKFDKLLLKLANNNTGFINKYFNPTFYLVLKKKTGF